MGGLSIFLPPTPTLFPACANWAKLLNFSQPQMPALSPGGNNGMVTCGRPCAGRVSLSGLHA